MNNAQAMALPLSFAAGVVLLVAGTLASPPLTGILYLTAVLAGAGASYFLLGLGGQEEAATRPDRKRTWNGVAEHLHDPVHADADEATSP